ncbi:MAG: hypothetical protein JXB35_02910 [Anaerolineae bacterium]|nr:hypothetical protein [Anaerolineae bacterium]
MPVAAQIPDECTDLAVIGGFTVCFVGKNDNADATSTWTYAIQSDDDNKTAALSHWVLELCPAVLDDVSPNDGDNYTTPGSFGNIMGRAGINYTIAVGQDPTLGITGIKFEDGEPNLGEDGAVETDIFQFTLPTDNIGYAPIQVGTKAGQNRITGAILGPRLLNVAAAGAGLLEACQPTAVGLVDFSAETDGNEVVVSWETASEIDNLGFNLYRSSASEGPWEQLNPEIIRAKSPGTAFGGVYTFTDAEVIPGKLYHYRLESLETSGASTFHGPISIEVVGDPTSVTLVAFGVAESAPLPAIGLLVGSLAVGWVISGRQQSSS